MGTPVQGQVKRVITRKAGSGTAYTVQLMDNMYYGHGFKPPGCNEGDAVEFEHYQNNAGYTQIVEGSLKVVAGAQKQPQQPQGQPQAAPAAGGQSKAGYWDEKEKRDLRTQRAIQYQASRNAALEVAKMALEHDCLSLGQKKADKLDILMAFIDETTDRFNKDVSDFTENGSRSGQYDGDAQDNQATEVGEFDQ